MKFRRFRMDSGVSVHLAKSLEAQRKQSSAECAEEAGTSGLVLTAESGLGSRPTGPGPGPLRAPAARALRARGRPALPRPNRGSPAAPGRNGPGLRSRHERPDSWRADLPGPSDRFHTRLGGGVLINVFYWFVRETVS